MRRGLDPGAEPDRQTAAEWLATTRAAREADDDHRAVVETDVRDLQLDEVAEAVGLPEPDPADGLAPAGGLSADASEAAIRTAARRAAAIAAKAADTASQNAAEPDDGWDLGRRTLEADHAEHGSPSRELAHEAAPTPGRDVGDAIGL